MLAAGAKPTLALVPLCTQRPIRGAAALGALLSDSYSLSTEQNTPEAQSNSASPELQASRGAKTAKQTFHQCPRVHGSH